MTPLTVQVDPGNPQRINITGDGFDFSTAANVARVDITGVGRLVAVSFAEPRADVQWSGNLMSSSSYVFSYRSAAQMHMPGEIGHSIKDVSHLSGIYISTNSPAWGGISFTSNYVFMARSDGLIRRRNLTTHGIETMIISASVTQCRMVAYSDDIVYVYGIEDTDSYVIYKLNFSTSEMTKVADESPAGVYRTYACARVRNLDKDVMVCTGTTSGIIDKLFVMLFDLINDTVITAQTKTSAYTYMQIWQFTGPQVITHSGNIVIFNATENYADIINGDSYCRAPIIRVDIETGIITLIEQPMYSYNAANIIEEFWTNAEMASATDVRDGKLYYGTFYNENDPNVEKFYVRHANPSSYIPVLSHDFGDIIGYGGPHLYYGDGGTVVLRHIDANQDLLKLSRPDGSLLCTLEAAQEANWGAIDDENEMYWTVDPDNDRLVGKSFGAGADRDIIIDDWGSTSPPAGLFGRKLFMFNGYAVVSGCTDEVLGGTEYFWFLYPSG